MVSPEVLSPEICSRARLTRDARFDGRFFTAVKTTGIYCRPICPATTPKEENIVYYPFGHKYQPKKYHVIFPRIQSLRWCAAESISSVAMDPV